MQLHYGRRPGPSRKKTEQCTASAVQSGFMIGDRLLRPAMVTVARRGDAPATGETKIDTKV